MLALPHSGARRRCEGENRAIFRTVREVFLVRTLDLASLEALNQAFIAWVEDEYHQAEHSVLKMRPVDRFGLDLSLIRFLPPNSVNDELFFVEEERTVFADNTFSLRRTRFEAPRDVRSRKIQVRFDRARFGRVVVYYMIRAHFGLDQNPFSHERLSLLRQQQEIFDTLRVHCQQGGLCLIVGEPGTGKSIIKHVLREHDPKRMLTPVVNRTLHTYHSILRILCEAFQIDTDGVNFRCERRLIIEEAQRLNHLGKMLVPIVDDAHLLDVDSLRRLRLLFEDFPTNHNLVLIAQPGLLTKLALTVNDDIKSRVTYSALVPKLTAEDMNTFILAELDRVALAHRTFSTCRHSRRTVGVRRTWSPMPRSRP